MSELIVDDAISRNQKIVFITFLEKNNSFQCQFITQEVCKNNVVHVQPGLDQTLEAVSESAAMPLRSK
jgi:hypothetical protein